MSKATVKCEVHGIRSAFAPRQIAFNTGADLSLKLGSAVGPQGISLTAADLLDVGATVFQIDRHITSWRSTNAPTLIRLRMKLRKPNAWSTHAIETLQSLLHILGNVVWKIEFEKGLNVDIPKHKKEKTQRIRQVALFSGGVDSTCGAMTLRNEVAETKLVSFYRGQKTLQASLASELGFSVPVQWSMNWARDPGRGRSFYFRSFMFLSLAGAVAESWNVRTVFQFENGILATAIPPTPYWMMTKHAHPSLHQNMVELFRSLFGGKWKILNPFLALTKRECVQRATNGMERATAMRLLSRTETCWYLRSNNVFGGKKRPGRSCGVCVPCLLRNTAIPGEGHQFDLRKDTIKNHRRKGEAFRAYYAFLRRVLDANKSSAKFYVALPAAGRQLVQNQYGLELDDLQRLFGTFAREFMETFCGGEAV